MSRKGKPKSFYNSIFWDIGKLLAQYEITLEMMDNYWQFRATYFGELLFDFYPKNRKICVFKDGQSTWNVLDDNYMNHLDRIAHGYISTGAIDINTINK